MENTTPQNNQPAPNLSEPTLSPSPAAAQPPVQQQVSPIEVKQKQFQKKKIIYRIDQVIWSFLALVETLLAFRIALKAVGADPNSGFVTLVNNISDPFAGPFEGIIKPTVMNTSVLDWSILVAAAVYGLLAFGSVQIIRLILKPVSKEEVEQAVGES
jgi:uncharacterized protein YggT (Ycf19 family)